MMKYFPLLLVPLPGSFKYSQRMKSQTEQQGNREGINIIRKISNLPLSIFLSFFLSLSVYFRLFLCLSHSSSNISKNQIALHSTLLVIWYLQDCLFCLPKDTVANGPWCINEIIPLWPNHSENVTTKFHNCSK